MNISEANYRSYGYAYCVNPVSEHRCKPEQTGEHCSPLHSAAQCRSAMQYRFFAQLRHRADVICTASTGGDSLPVLSAGGDTGFTQ